MSKHTPAPWAIDAPDDRRSPVRITTAAPIFEGATLPAEIARVTRIHGPCGNYVANARLIAAAPDLLFALRNLVKLHDGYVFLCGEDDEFIVAAAFEVSREAIAKATGEP
jgi:hypothetical protein